MSGPSHTDAFAGLVGRLSRLSRRRASLDALTGGGYILATVAPALVCLVASESLLYLSPTTKVGCLLLLALGTIAALAYFVVKPVARPPSHLATAQHAENHFGGLHQRLSNALQLGSRADGACPLVTAAVNDGFKLVETLDLDVACPPAAALQAWRRAAALVAICVVGFLPLLDAASSAVGRLATPTTHFRKPSETQLFVSPGNLTLVSGDTLSLEAKIGGVVPTLATFQIRQDGSNAWVDHVLQVRGGRAVLPLRDLRHSFAYRFVAHDALSNAYSVRVLPRPMVARTHVRYDYPAYTNLPRRIDGDGGDMVAPVGTNVVLTAESTRPLASAALIREDGSRVEATTLGDIAEFAFTIGTDHRFHIALTDTAGIANADPVVHRILAIADRPPEVAIRRPGQDSELGKDMRVPLLIEALDDYGVAHAELRYVVNDESAFVEVPVALDSALELQLTQTYTWDLSTLDLLPGDRLSYRVRVFDADAITGPNAGESRTYTLRFPSIYEIQQAVEHQQEEAISRLETAREEIDRLQNQAEEVRREVLKHDEITWERRTEARDILDQQEDIRRRLDRTAERVDRTHDQIEQSGLLSDETARKLLEVRQMMSALETPELRRATDELEQAIEATDPAQVEAAIDRMIQEQDQLQASLDRAIALLKQVHNDQMLDALTRQLESLAEQERDIAASATAIEDTRPLEPQQIVARREAEDLQERLRSAVDQLNPQIADRVHDLAEAFDATNLPERMDQAARDLRANQTARSRAGTQALTEDLNAFAQRMRSIRDDRIGRQKEDLTRELAGVLSDLVRLSQSQEQTAADARDGRAAGSVGEAQTRNLSAALRLAERMLSAAHRTFLVPKEAAAGLGQALEKMEETAGHLQRAAGSRAAQSALEAMSELNTSAIAVNRAIQNLRGAGSAAGFEEMLEQLEQAAAQQSGLNTQTQQLFGQGRAQPGGIEQLAVQQRAIQQMLESIRQKLGTQEERVLGDLENVGQEMDDVARALEEGALSRRTVDRQQRILSRLLDAQRSARERGFSRAREARSGRDSTYGGASELPGDLGESTHPLRAKLREALRQGYPGSYHPLMRAYFDRLIRDARTEELSTP